MLTSLRTAAITLASLCVLSAGSALAQPATETGLSGFWSPGFGGMPRRGNAAATAEELMSLFPEGSVFLDDAGAVEFPPGEYGGLAIHPDLQEEAKSYDPRMQTTVANTCRPPGLIYSMQGPFPIEIFEGRDMIIMKLEYFDLVRVIFMNQDTHPVDWPSSQTGHSIGHWDGDTLVIDTVNLQSGTLFNNGVNHSEDIHLIERFRLADPNSLVVSQEFSDPGSFTGTGTRVFSFSRGDDHVYPYDCDPSYGISFDAIEGPDQP